MLPQREDLAGVVDELRQTVRTLEARVATLEEAVAQSHARDASVATAPASHTEAVAAVAGPGAAPAPRGSSAAFDAAHLAALAGQGLLGLAGAYLLRALTEQGALPPALGYSAGAAYAAVWLMLVYRAGRRGAALAAALFGTVSCMVAYPLVWEATSRLHLLGPYGAAGALTLMTAASLLVAASIRLQTLAWVVITFAVATAVALLPEATRLLPVLVFIIGLGIATLWLGYVIDWFALRWPMAAVANLLVCWVIFSRPPGRGLETPATAVALGLLLTASYLGSILLRTLWRARDVLPFEVVQGFAALAVGIGGALVLGGEGGTGGTIVVGAATLLFGAGCYVAAVFVARQRGFTTNFHFYTTMALALVVTGVLLVLTPTSASLALSLCVALSGVMAARRGLPVLAIHAAIYAIASGLASGLATAALMRMVARAGADGGWPVLGVTGVVLTVVAAVSLGVPTAAQPAQPEPPEWPLGARLARVVLLAIAVAGTAAWAIELALPLVRSLGAVDLGALATVRTVVLAAAAVVLARLTRRRGFADALWLAYATLAVGAIKLLVEDFPTSRPATLFIALAAYGIALMAAPRLARRAT